ncbi:uncharacterized protein K452DRAFT_287943 [Aplosporella prunicola CBS 121167]|uniref:Large ribosomal subunit protein bL28c n=1 Tax=Aplosporella prunicola CBS 121167 TaxID=1176127 RepID=A0A6A6BDC4_9PEZI|nr:uncharacterized protein K452DRAFT_287943 [Aplosporella prunicola CBS 121167]KAF2141234.1 hypothetical protein K452DRAFT_287943 [Aplosporella prunicola CBS 121167]
MALRLARPSFMAQQARTFTSSAALSAKSANAKLRDEHANVPIYPYGPNRWYKQSNHGLYGGARIQFGNNVSDKTELKTRRRWHPNIQHKRLYSKALNRFVRVRLSTRVLRTIDKVGGIDEYLLGEKTARIRDLGMGGWLLRWRLFQTDHVKRRFAKQRAELGLPATTLAEELMGMRGQMVTEQQLAQEIASYDQQLDKEDAVAVSEDEAEAIVTGAEVQELEKAKDTA